jgi:hypothetical protein
MNYPRLLPATGDPGLVRTPNRRVDRPDAKKHMQETNALPLASNGGGINSPTESFCRYWLQGWKRMHMGASALASLTKNSKAACQTLCLALLLFPRAGAQAHPGTPSLPTLPSGVPANSREDYDIPSNDPAEQARRLRALNIERQKRVVSDANKLLKLTTEFNAEIARANPESLTPAQLRKLAEIERVAKDLKENMTATILPSTDPRSLLDPRLR